MSLIRQVWWLLATVLTLAVGGAVAVNLRSARDTLQDQVRLKNEDNAQALALVLSQQQGDLARIELYVQAQADTGHYRYIRYVGADGKTGYERRFDAPPGSAPQWFRAMLPIEAPPGVAQVSDGWRALGRVEVASHVAYAHADLWRGGWRALAWMLGVGVLAAALAALAVRRLQRVLQATVDQAQALSDGRYLTQPESEVPELRRMTAAMNTMVERVRELFASQSAQAEAWRRQAHCDPLTGLSHRRHFLDQLDALLTREDGAEGGQLILIRVAGLEPLNRKLGHARVDAGLKALAARLQGVLAQHRNAMAGRLNGTDFALFVPMPGLSAAEVQAFCQALAAALTLGEEQAQAFLGQARGAGDMPLQALMSRADAALALAEAGTAFDLRATDDELAGVVPGEHAWRQRLLAALAADEAALAEYPVLHVDGRLMHLECPLRLSLNAGEPPTVAARWLPLALRVRLTPLADIKAVLLALAAIARDGRRRSVHLAGASLADPGFVARLRECLSAAPGVASSLSLEVPESVALEQPLALQTLVHELRPLGTRVGLEHAGGRLHQIPNLLDLGLDYVKLDASLCTGLADNPAAGDFLRSTVRLLAALNIPTCAEGVRTQQDADSLRDCGVSALTGPWASQQAAPG
jgi:predicted signal transduction protein with EAL and GGDEF domain